MKPQQYTPRGFVLLEVLLAFALLSLGILGALTAMLHVKNNVSMAYWKSIAVDEAESMLERLRSNRTDTARASEISTWNSELSRLLPQGSGLVTFEKAAFCRVTVQWFDAAGASNQVELETLL